MDDSLKFVPLQDPGDRLLLPWLDLFETAFPPNERLLVSTILDMLCDPVKGTAKGITLVAILNDSGDFIGMAMYELPPEKPVALLWYVAVTSEQRSQGWGAEIYQKILAQVEAEKYQALLFEVEIPGEVHASAQAERRIRFYQKNGAKLLRGIHYLQSVGPHQPLTPMHLMIHPLQEMDAEMAFILAKSAFGEAVQRTGRLGLE